MLAYTRKLDTLKLTEYLFSENIGNNLEVDMLQYSGTQQISNVVDINVAGPDSQEIFAMDHILDLCCEGGGTEGSALSM